MAWSHCVMTHWQRATAPGNRRRKPACSSPPKKFVLLKCRKNEVCLEIKETTKCVGSSNEKETLTLDNRTSLEEDCWDVSFQPGCGRSVEVVWRWAVSLMNLKSETHLDSYGIVKIQWPRKWLPECLIQSRQCDAVIPTYYEADEGKFWNFSDVASEGTCNTSGGR